MTDHTTITLGQLLAHHDPTVKRGAMGILKQLQRLDTIRAFKCYQEHRTGKYAGLSIPHIHDPHPSHIGHSDEHSKNCATRKEYGNCPPWPHG